MSPSCRSYYAGLDTQYRTLKKLGRRCDRLLTRDKARQATSSFGRYQEELSVTCRWQNSFRRCLLTLEPCSFHAFSKSSFVGSLFALAELVIMARDRCGNEAAH
jgi:hypothetical protein